MVDRPESAPRRGGGQDEHPNEGTPAAGAQFIGSVIVANPDVWAKTVFVVVWDEHGGGFDHVPPPIPPAGTSDEFVTRTSPGGVSGGGLPIGVPASSSCRGRPVAGCAANRSTTPRTCGSWRR
jgi:phospholipase C